MQAALVTLCSAKVIQSHNTDASRFGHPMPAKVIRLHEADASRFGHPMPAKVIQPHNPMQAALVTLCLQRSFGYTMLMQPLSSHYADNSLPSNVR